MQQLVATLRWSLHSRERWCSVNARGVMEVGRLEALLLFLRVHCGNLRRGGGMREM